MNKELNDLPFGILWAFLAKYCKKHGTTRWATDSKEYKDFVKIYKERDMKPSNKVKWETALKGLIEDKNRDKYSKFGDDEEDNDSCNAVIPQSDVEYENIDSCTDELLEDEETAQIEGRIIQNNIDAMRGK